MSSGVSAIEMRNVAVGAMRDQEMVVVEDVNWSVAAGEYWVIGGLQGSGKSDFLLFTGGLMPPTAGEYRLFGEPMPIFEDARMTARLRLGLVFETGQLFNHLTVWENVALPLRYHKNLTKAEAADEVRPYLKTMELESWADSTPGAIARNWQKRVALARALILQPEVLLVDNPLAGLDLRHSYWWMECLEKLSTGHELLQGRPVTLIVTTADLRPWRGRACRFAVIRDKHFTALGGWAELESEKRESVTDLLLVDTGATDKG